MKKSILYCACAAIAISFVACTNSDLRKPDINSTSFGVMVGGSVDPEHTFNVSEQQSVTVSVESESLVRVYANVGHANKLVVSKKINGTEPIYFDAMPDVKKVTVLNMNGGQFRNSNVGETVSFVQSRAVHNGNSTVSAQAVQDYKEFSYYQVKSDVNSAPFNDLKSSSPLYYSKSGSFDLNLCWYTSESGNSATIGIYYYENENKVEVPIFTNDKEYNWIQYETPPSWGDPYWQSYSDAHMPDITNTSPDISRIRTKGIHVTVPANTVFGFYVLGNDQGEAKYYSEEIAYDLPTSGSFAYIKNQLDNWLSWGNPSYINGEKKYFGHVAFIDVQGRKYLAFDDGCEAIRGRGYAKGVEYYHMVFSVSGDLSDQICNAGSQDEEPQGGEPQGEEPQGGEPQGEEPQGEEPQFDPNEGKLSNDTLAWILACEDLGTKADYDFNDVVLRITHVAGSTEASVQLLAAGGTLPSTICYGNDELGEVHELFGVGDTIMVNTWPNGKKLEPIYVWTVTVPEYFTMTADDMGGFMIKRSNTVSAIVAAPEKGNVPYMICIPDTWEWPRERVSIVDAYPSFSEWCSDHTKAQDWYKRPVEEKIYRK